MKLTQSVRMSAARSEWSLLVHIIVELLKVSWIVRGSCSTHFSDPIDNGGRRVDRVCKLPVAKSVSRL
jgi:hypothetical protein